jgi:hypothetical protein
VAAATDLRGGRFDFARPFQSAPRAMLSALMLPMDSTTKRAAASGSRPRLLTAHAQPPATVTGRPPGGSGSGNTPYGWSGACSWNSEIDHGPRCHIAARPWVNPDTISPPAGSVRGATPRAMLSAKSSSAAAMASDVTPGRWVTGSITSPPPCHTHG